MTKHLPDIVDAFDFIEKRRVLEGSLPLVRMERLRGLLLEPDGDVRFRLAFGREGGILAVRGYVAAEVALECQCCLSLMTHRVENDFALGLVSSIDEANLLPEPFEPLLLDDKPFLRVVDLIEDEMLLSIPHVPNHGTCESFGLPGLAEEDKVLTVRKPFANLAMIIPLDTTKV